MSKKNITMKLRRRTDGNQRRRRQQELDAKREERAAPRPEGMAPSRYRAKKGAGTMAPRKPRRHLRRQERENYIPAIGAAAD